MTRIFLCHAKEDIQAVRNLYEKLRHAGFDPWLDEEDILAGQNPDYEIRQTITEQIDFVLICLSRTSVQKRGYVNKEIKWALDRQDEMLPGDIFTIPVKLEACDLPFHLRERFPVDLSAPDGFEKLLKSLRHQSGKIRNTEEKSLEQKFGKLFGDIPEIPANFIPRPEEFDDLKALILNTESKPVGITSARKVGVHGMGGIGKTVLAAVLARQEDIRQRFSDGIFWITLGQSPETVSRQLWFASKISGQKEDFSDIQTGKARLKELLESRSCLIVLDDAWEMCHISGFTVLGRNSQLLITTRNANLITGLDGEIFSLDVLTTEQARELLSAWSKQTELPKEADKIVRECGNLPLAVAMVGAMLRGKSLSYWETVLKRLQQADLEKIRQDFPDYPYPTLFAALQVSVEALAPNLQKQYSDFAVFPEDTQIPYSVIAILWKSKGLDEGDIEDALYRLADLALLKRDESGMITLHDLQRDYIRKQVKNELPELHNGLIDAYALSPRPIGLWNEKNIIGNSRFPVNDGYFFQHFCYHLNDANRHSELKALLLSFDWLQEKLNHFDIAQLINEFSFLSQDSDLSILRQALELSAHILAKDTTQLASQLHGRLCDNPSSEIKSLLNYANPDFLWLRPMICRMAKPGGSLLRILEGHTDEVYFAAISHDGIIISLSKDNSLIIWSLNTGERLYRLTWDDFYYSLAVNPDSGIAVFRQLDDNRIELYDIVDKETLFMLEGHSGRITSAAFSPDGMRIISTSEDKTLKVWDLKDGSLIHTLKGHDSAVNSVAITPDGSRAVSISDDNTIKVWNLNDGLLLFTFKGHSNMVRAFAISPDGKFVISGSVSDSKLIVWDITNGNILFTFEKGSFWHPHFITFTPDGTHIVISSSMENLGIWNLSEQEENFYRLAGHSESVNSVAISRDGTRAVSSSKDKNLIIWDLTVRKKCDYYNESQTVQSLAINSDGTRAVSASSNILSVWDLKTCECLFNLDGHFTLDEHSTDIIMSVAISPDGTRIVSASFDANLMVWDINEQRHIFTFEKRHSLIINSVAFFPDGKRIVSASWDKTLMVWDINEQKHLFTIEGGNDNAFSSAAIRSNGNCLITICENVTVWDLSTKKQILKFEGDDEDDDVFTSLAISPDEDYIVSGSRNSTVKVWNLNTGENLLTFKGHSDIVWSVAICNDNIHAISVSKDKTLKIWNFRTGKIIGTFYADAPLFSCAVSPDGRTIVAGDDFGNVHFFRLENTDRIDGISSISNRFP